MLESNIIEIGNKTKAAEEAIREFILDEHPCVMAQSVVADDNITIFDYGKMHHEYTYEKLFNDLEKYIENVDEKTMKFQTFIAAFTQEVFSNEITFENALWRLLFKLHQLDTKAWDENTSSDPGSPKFSYSLHGVSFYVVGMHPESSRYARSAPFPMIVFNLHSQFELLRSANRYDRVRDLIRRRDKEYQGSINPMLDDFGNSSEARQYSGRKVEKDWKCPYHFD
ncbi:YqcI/YcgG family protein [Galbibacter sp. BG1]|uniref:guanitoxin biosynthesis heme-dependent pre-guanitoxin N-hydroxylase GntA n=1 Tax=Galbibacter sp. BG1 TaxID=1170699 RepID=UPI0015C10F25|nr:guanitoxin biosynthesis heme-dependent pre-guanitoxin N-hydroxylase GntA [Galbibacter sp. BG1]QLE02845.1 YqcI/YcgG family protein [Galbibacter sp. BG1]